MKKILITLIATFLLGVKENAQNDCDLSQNLEKFIQVERLGHEGKYFLIPQIQEVQENQCFSKLVNDQPNFLNYLLTNYSSITNMAELLTISDSIAMRKKYFNDLQLDSNFINILDELVSKTIEKNTIKDTINMHTLLDFAIKYFSIRSITSDGIIKGKVCAGINDIINTEPIRYPFIEAFAFSTILNYYSDEKFNMLEEFTNSLKEIGKFNFGIDPQERLLRAQGAMYVLMSQNKKLIQLLQLEYQSQKDYLPFVLIDKL